MRQECFGLGTPAPGWGGLLALARVSPLLGLAGVAPYPLDIDPTRAFAGRGRFQRPLRI